HLPQIRRVWLSPRMKEVLHFVPIVRVSFDAKTRNQPDYQYIGFAERVPAAAAYCGDQGRHIVHAPRSPRRTYRSIKLEANCPDYLAPLLGFLSDEPAEIRGRTWQDRPCQIGKPSFQLGVGEASVDLGVEPIDNLFGCIPGSTDTKNCALLEARQE